MPLYLLVFVYVYIYIYIVQWPTAYFVTDKFCSLVFFTCFTLSAKFNNKYPKKLYFFAGRYLRDSKLFEIGGGTSEVRRLVIGREINKEYK